MPYFVKVGAIPENLSGVGARGYHLFRRGLCVVVLWGGIVVGSGRRFYWNSKKTQRKKFRFRSVDGAQRKVAALLAERTSRGYSRLPAGAKIRSRVRAAGRAKN